MVCLSVLFMFTLLILILAGTYFAVIGMTVFPGYIFSRIHYQNLGFRCKNLQNTGKKCKTPLYVKIMRNWRNFNGIKKNSIPLSRILMG